MESTQRMVQLDGRNQSIGMTEGEGINNTNELYIMKYNQAMKTANKEEWEAAVKTEH